MITKSNGFTLEIIFITVSFYGNVKEKLSQLVVNNGLCGIDRIVPVGKTADFSLIWDGYDLVMQMTRVMSF